VRRRTRTRPPGDARGRRLRFHRLRIAAAILVVLAGAAAAIAVAFGSWTGAQLRAVVVLSITQKTPTAAWAVRLVTDKPRIEEMRVAGLPATVVRPGEGNGPWPAVVFVNGATRRGRHHPKVQRLARGLARAGFLAVVPDLPGLSLGAITPATTAATIRVVGATARRRDVRGRVALYGVSVGATLCLLAAESRELLGRVSVVGGEAPWVDLEKVIRLATTGEYGTSRYHTDPYVRLAIARSLAAGLPPGPDRRLLLRTLLAVSDTDPEPLAGLQADGLGRAGRALVELLLNRRTQQFASLYARLPRRVREGVVRLSPLVGARRLRVPVELASAPHDKYFPPAESRALAAVAPRVRVSVTTTLDHAIPQPSLRDFRGLLRFDGFVVRFLRQARKT
jgi:pimeloyl-ACP methyl ester carboxylesterase